MDLLFCSRCDIREAAFRGGQIGVKILRQVWAVNDRIDVNPGTDQRSPYGAQENRSGNRNQMPKGLFLQYCVVR